VSTINRPDPAHIARARKLMGERYTPLRMALDREQELLVRNWRAKNALRQAMQAPNATGSPLFNHVTIALLILEGKR
jgi:hypothetical protein